MRSISASSLTSQHRTAAPPGYESPPEYVALPIESNEHRRVLLTDARLQTRPKAQFKAQATRERERIQERLSTGQEISMFDKSSDFQANAENTVRSLWISWGIWSDLWGPAWPKSSRPSSAQWCLANKFRAPFWGIPEDCSWPHEDEPGPNRGVSHQVARQQQLLLRALMRGDWDQYTTQASMPFTSTSRPCHQFFCQIFEEIRRLNLDDDAKQRQLSQKLGARAYDTVKGRWVDQGIWDAGWGRIPGWSWRHEKTHKQTSPKSSSVSFGTNSKSKPTCNDIQEPEPDTASVGIFSNPRPSKRKLPHQADVETQSGETQTTSRSSPAENTRQPEVREANAKRRRGLEEHVLDAHPTRRQRRQCSRTYRDYPPVPVEGTTSSRPRPVRPAAAPVSDAVRQFGKTAGTTKLPQPSTPLRRSERIATKAKTMLECSQCLC